MKKTFIFLSMVLIAIFLAGCALSPEVIPVPSPQPLPSAIPTAVPASNQIPKLGQNWRITLNQSGGIMGISRSLQVSSDGSLLVTDLRTHKSGRGSLSRDQVKALEQLLDGVIYQPVTQPSGCADCYIFDLQISSDGTNFETQLNQIDLPKSGLQPLVDSLSGFMRSLEK